MSNQYVKSQSDLPQGLRSTHLETSTRLLTTPISKYLSDLIGTNLPRQRTDMFEGCFDKIYERSVADHAYIQYNILRSRIFKGRFVARLPGLGLGEAHSLYKSDPSTSRRQLPACRAAWERRRLLWEGRRISISTFIFLQVRPNVLGGVGPIYLSWHAKGQFGHQKNDRQNWVTVPVVRTEKNTFSDRWRRSWRIINEISRIGTALVQ
jgi:hypothetical protein